MPLHRYIISSLIITIIALCLWPLPASAQQKSVRRTTRDTVEQAEKTPPVAMLQPSKNEFLSGEANVAVKGNQDPIIRLGLAQNGVTMIEFPAADRFFAIHPGNSDLVTVDDSPTKATDHFLILRAGSGFASPALLANAGKGPATSIIVQMQSGMVVTFLIYPVNQIAQQAHRCVVGYDRDEVITARRAAGLAVNLDRAEQDRPRTVSLRLAPTTPDPSAEQAGAKVSTPAANESASFPVTAEIDARRIQKRNKNDGGNPGQAAANALAEVVSSPKNFKSWSKPQHGLSIAISQPREVDDRSRVVVVAARNTHNAPIRLVPGAPDIYIQTFDDKGKTLQIEQLKKLTIETTTMNGAIPAGTTIYYAVVYETPILGTNQRLRVGLAQIEAADAPSTAELSSKSK